MPDQYAALADQIRKLAELLGKTISAPPDWPRRKLITSTSRSGSPIACRRASSQTLQPKERNSMRRPFIAGNWKMNTGPGRRRGLGGGSGQRARAIFPSVDLVVCPPFVYLEAVRQAIAGEPGRRSGHRTCITQRRARSPAKSAPAMLVDLGCQYVILGHSERRQLFKETDAEVNKKLLAALAAGLTPIVCVGELLADREAGRTHEVIRAAVRRLAGRAFPPSKSAGS